MRWGSNWLQNAFIMLLEIADYVEWNPLFSSAIDILIMFFPFLINFAIHILNGPWYNVEAPLKKSNMTITSQKEKGKSTRMQPLLNFGMPLYKLTNAPFKHLLLPLMHDQNHFLPNNTYRT